mmetsp:Transcript_49602/g.153135  ORF Transcript_49602/g.153135 Transcript_49602/m.153135 type:complete len:182 (-) Transcript_49602:258-803(-)
MEIVACNDLADSRPEGGGSRRVLFSAAGGGKVEDCRPMPVSTRRPARPEEERRARCVRFALPGADEVEERLPTPASARRPPGGRLMVPRWHAWAERASDSVGAASLEGGGTGEEAEAAEDSSQEDIRDGIFRFQERAEKRRCARSATPRSEGAKSPPELLKPLGSNLWRRRRPSKSSAEEK